MSVTRTFKGKRLKRSEEKGTLNIKSSCHIYSTASSFFGKNTSQNKVFSLAMIL
jgi:hypothetical protein